MTDPVVYFAWQTKAHEECVRGTRWWIAVSIVALAFFVYALISGNFAFAVILLMFAMLMALSRKSQDELIEVVIADVGVSVNDEFYPFRDMQKFFLIENPRKVYFSMRRLLTPHLDFFVPEDVDLDDLREILREHVLEDVEQTAEPLIDQLARKLKLF